MADVQPVVSGFGYTATAVDGTCPGRLADFGGRATPTVDKDGRRHCLVGDGAEHPGLVRFHQKDPGTDDKDVRVWFITDGGAAPPVRAGRRFGEGVARDVMIRNPSRVAGTDTPVEVASVMRSLMVAFLPVCDINGDLLGIIALDDLPRAVCGDNSTAATAAALAREPAVAIGVDDRVDGVWDLMAEHGMWLLPVLDRRRLAGVIRYSARRGARPRRQLQRVGTHRAPAVP